MDLEKIGPEEIGIEPDRLKVARRIIEGGLENGLYPAAVFLIGRFGKILEPVCYGSLGCATEGTGRVTAGTVFDIASITKPVATATSILILLDRGEVHLGQQLPEFFQQDLPPHCSEITIRHLLTHTSGLPASKDLHQDGQNRERVIARILSTPLETRPGSRYNYSCLGYILLGAIVETVSGSRLNEFARENIFRPLGMVDTCFNPEGEMLGRTASTGNCPVRGRSLVGEVHDPNAWAMGGVSGNAGLFSTVPDLAKFCLMLMRGGAGVLSPLAVRLEMTSLLEGRQTAGWFAYPNELLPCGDLLSRHTIGHTGFTGTSVVIDAACDLFVILLTNRTCNPDDGSKFRTMRRLFHNTVAQAVTSF
ncbi:MAG: beta-lactamase family protein [Armatimonadetes bacterium]|nr:beta-lactamase family protein [Armatimonadota bacterium]